MGFSDMVVSLPAAINDGRRQGGERLRRSPVGDAVKGRSSRAGCGAGLVSGDQKPPQVARRTL